MAHSPGTSPARGGRRRSDADVPHRGNGSGHVRLLLDAGAMQIVAVTDPMSLGFRRQTMIGVRCSGELEQVAEQLAAMHKIDYVVITAGSFDLLIEVVCEDDDELLGILSRVRAIPSVTATETFVYLKLCKQTYSWGTR